MQLNANDWERSAFGSWVKNAIDSERQEFAKLFIKKNISLGQRHMPPEEKAIATFFYFRTMLTMCR